MDLQPIDVHADERGVLFEAVHLPHDGQVFVITIRPGFVRGNHYHTRKTEKFVLVHGVATITTRNRDTGEVKKYQLIDDMPEIVTVTPGNVHNVTAQGDDCILLSWVDEIFNPADTDTFAEDV